MAETIKLNCTNCGRELDIPSELEEFSCMYCGQRLCKSELLRPRTDAHEAEVTLRERLPETITRYPDYYQKITRKDFEPAFDAYEAENRELLLLLDDVPAERLPSLCTSLLDALDRHMQSDKRWNSKSRRSQVIFETKLVLAVFFCPLVKKLGLRCAESFCTELHTQWISRLPKENWLPGDYQVLVDGFRRRKLCFITTATCRSEGKPDDCAELTAFRAFRDGWLSRTADGQALIDAYYDVAPSIVACIDYCDSPQECYAEIRSRWLTPCYRALCENRDADCRALYVDMVQTLCARYLQ